jgi:hypothetical protein
MAIGSTLDKTLFVAAYSDEDVVNYDTDSGDFRGLLKREGTLATAESQGNIYLFDVKTLKLMYQLKLCVDATGTKKLAFASDNLRLLDIRGKQFNVSGPTDSSPPRV